MEKERKCLTYKDRKMNEEEEIDKEDNNRSNKQTEDERTYK